MNQEIKQKWVEALRSGKYKQGKRVLRSGDKFCCLGVLCEVVGIDYNGNLPYLPSDVMKLAGLDCKNPIVSYSREEITLASLNDDLNFSFHSIAEVIERNL